MGIPLIRTTNLREGKLDLEGLIFVTESFHKKNKKSQLLANDLLIARHGNHGQACLVPANLGEANCLNIVIVRPDQKCVSPNFMLDLFNFTIQKELSSKAAGSTQTVVNTKEIAKQIVIIPSLPEQNKIAKILSTWDKAITTTEQLLVNSQQQKKVLIQQLLTGKKRLLDNNGVRFSGAWKRWPLSSLVSLGKGKFDPKASNDMRECIELEHISQGTSTILGSTTTHESISTKSVFEKGSVLFGKLRPYLRKYWMSDRDGVCSTEIWVLNAKEGRVIPEYIFQIVQMDLFIESANKSSGTHMPRADWNIVKDISIPTPSVEEQLKIATVLSTADQAIIALQQKLDALKQEKKALMQQLLTGKRRVKNF
ncbi:EcoKI restriction-modification system protein HsdS [compost metagenome]